MIVLLPYRTWSALLEEKTFSLIFDDSFKLTVTSLDGPSGNRAILEAKAHVTHDSRGIHYV